MNKVTTIKITETSKAKTFLMGSLCLFSISFLLQLFVSNRYAVKNNDLQSAIIEKSQLEKDLSRLEYEDSLLSSLERVESKALELGYVIMSSKARVIGPAMFASLKAN